MQSIPQVELKPKANTLLINYAENEMPRFPAWLAARHRSGVPPTPPPHPLHHQRIPPLLVRFAHVLPRLCERLCGSAGASSACGRSAGAAVVQMFDCAAVSRGCCCCLSHPCSRTRGGAEACNLAFGDGRWVRFHPCLPPEELVLI